MNTNNASAPSGEIVLRAAASGTIGERNIIFLITPKVSVAFLYDITSLDQGLEKMKYHGYSAMPVITEDGSYAGTVSEGDFLWHVLNSGKPAQEDCVISDILREGWNPAVKVSASLDEVLIRVMDQNFVPVIDDREKFMGIITRRDIIRHFYKQIGRGK